ncbi:MAG TPA: BTAD domain-containing putative transcriptional regulator [Chloroflexota bacterium]|nr:BTAD domain-containing putative transcriptional regulator [Chloroflexota bacterium]
MTQNLANTTTKKLRLKLLGAPAVSIGGEPVTGFVSNKATALLFYLAATGKSYTRETLAGLLWGDSNEERARKNLRDVLFNLRPLVGDYLLISRQSIELNKAANYDVDVARFTTMLQDLGDLRNSPLSPTAKVLLWEAVDLYEGEFLEGFHVSQAPDFEIWLLEERERLHRLAVQSLHILTEYLTQQGNTGLGIKYASRLLALEPWREETHRQLMHLLVWSGQRSAALAQYETCRRLLRENLGVEPEPETQRLYESILRGDLIVVHTTLPSGEKLSTKGMTHNLPAPLTRFVGREADLAEITDRLLDPDCRLTTIVGPGGVGKTRLALQAVQKLLPPQQMSAAFADGIYLVRLAAVEQNELNRSVTSATNFNPVAAAIADALQLTLRDPEAPTSRIQNYLREKEILLVMDNFEHLAAAASYITALLAAAPQLKMLVTSRSRLNVRGEQVYLLEGLTFPIDTADTLSWQGYSSVQLFLQTARAVDAGFTLSPAEQTAVVRICQLVNGLPLGIELAASWVRVLSCQDIVRELEQNLRFLSATMRDVPERHRSLWAVFSYSWNMLTTKEQQALRQLSVFRNGFSREAAETVAGVSLPVLLKLIDHSFVRRVTGAMGQPRFEILEVLRLYVAEHLQQNPAEGMATHGRHQDYFISFLHQAEGRLQNEEQRLALEEIGEEIENIRAAWRWVILQQNVTAVNQGLSSLFDYYDMRSRFQEGQDVLQRAAAMVAAQPDSPEKQLVWGRLLARQGWFTFHVGRYGEAHQLLQQSVALIRPLYATLDHTPLDLVFCLNYHLGDDTQAASLCQEALTLSKAADYQQGMGIALNILSQIAYRAGDYDAAQSYSQQSLEIVTQLGNPWSRAYSLSNLAQVAFARQAYDEARRLNHIILEIREEMGDVRGIAMCLEMLARTAVAQDHLSDAHTLYQRSLYLYREIGNQRGMISTLAGLGRLALQQEAYETACTHFADALQRAFQLKNVPDLLAIAAGLVGALYRMGRRETAVALEKLLATDPLPLPQLADMVQKLPK